jgi:hypothetical protein
VAIRINRLYLIRVSSWFPGFPDKSVFRRQNWWFGAVVCGMTGKRATISSLGLFVVMAVGCNRAPLTLDEIIDRNAEAMGGRAAIEAVQSIEVSLHISDPGRFEADGIYCAARPGKMRIDVSAGGKHVFTEAFDGQRGWEWNGKESKTASPMAAAALQHGVELPGHIFGLHEIRQRGHKLELAGRERIDGTDYYALRLTMRDGYQTTLYVDPNSWLITRRHDFRPLHVDIDPTPTTIEQKSWDFRKVDGVQFAFAGSETDLKTGKVLETSQIKSIKVNPTIDPTFFSGTN